MPSRGKLARRIVVFEWSYDRMGRAEDFCYAREDIQDRYIERATKL